MTRYAVDPDRGVLIRTIFTRAGETAGDVAFPRTGLRRAHRAGGSVDWAVRRAVGRVRRSRIRRPTAATLTGR